MASYLLFFLISLGSFFPVLGLFGIIPFDIYGIFAIFRIASGRPSLKLKYLIGIMISLFFVLLTTFRFGGEGFIPYARIVLILLDGVGVYWAFKAKLERNASTATDLLRIFLGAYLLCFVLWKTIPAAGILYFEDIKAWIATFPILLFIYFFLKNRFRLALLVLIAFIFVGVESGSRTLLLSSLLCFLFALFKLNYRRVLLISIPSLLFAAVIGGPILSQVASDTDDLSTIYRFYTTAKLIDYGFHDLLFGIGVSRWQNDLSSFLSWTPNATSFFEMRANPHFLPTEVVIYGGLISLAVFVYVLHHCLKNSPIAPFLLAFFVSSFFTTNTGVERVFVTITLFLAVWSSTISKQPNVSPLHSRPCKTPEARINA